MTAIDDGMASGARVSDDFTRHDFDFVARFAKENFGLNLPDTKLPVVHSRVSRRLRHLGMSCFKEYRELLEAGNYPSEKSELLSALTTNVTEFFRENHHFDTLTSRLKDGAVKNDAYNKRIRIWSAGCSTGQEPYSVAITLLENSCKLATNDVKILATDIDPAVVSKAKAGEYSPLEVEKLPESILAKYFDVAPDGSAKIKQQPKSLVHFGVFNLMDPFPFTGPFQAVFCRNVAIYFDKQTQAKIWAKFCDLLDPGGSLFIGHSERITGSAETMLKSIGITTYTKLESTEFQEENGRFLK